jgi:DNA-binding beta-propeller fold protein YncE
MKMKKLNAKWCVWMLVLTAVNGVLVPFCQAGGEYHLLKEIPVAWNDGCDSLTADGAGHRLYLVHGAQIEVMDLNKGSIIGGMTNASGIRGIAMAPILRRAFLCNGRDSKMDIVDLTRFKTVQAVKTEKVPGTILFDTRSLGIYAFNQDDQSVSEFEADDGDYEGTIKLPGKPGVAVSDEKTGLIYCALEDKDTLVVIDPGKRTITNQWDILPKEGVTAMAIDPVRHRLFLGCRNQMVLMVDSVKGTVLGGIPVNGQVDGLVFDPAGGRLFVSAGGTLTVAVEYTMTELKVMQTLELQKGRLLTAFDPMTHKVYLTAANGGGENTNAPKGSILVCGQ